MKLIPSFKIDFKKFKELDKWMDIEVKELDKKESLILNW